MATESQTVVPVEQYERLAEDFNNLRELYEDLKSKHEKCGKYIKEATEKYRAAKENAKQWAIWAERNGHRHRRNKLDQNNQAPSALWPEELKESHVTSSQTTEGEPDHLPLQQPARHISDNPEAISSRSLKRKRCEGFQVDPPSVRVKLEPASPSNPIELGSEDYGSPVIKRQKPVRTETSDLDAHVVRMDTPRRRRTSRALSEEVARPSTLLQGTSSLSEGNIVGANDDAVHIKAEQSHRDPLVTTRDFALPLTGGLTHDNALRQRSVNVPSTTHTGYRQANIKRKRQLELAFLSEDGDDQANRIPPRDQEPKTVFGNGHRLDTLLEEPSPDKHPLPKRPNPQTKSLERTDKLKFAIEQQKSSMKGRPEPRLAAFHRPRGLESPPSSAHPEDEPLRSRPLRGLRLEDFKINPNYLGSDFAFADTFRGREQRRCLQVCTCPDCCGGAFEQAVAMGVAKSTKTDNQVLEEYLGPDYAEYMNAYSSDKQSDVLVKAHARAFANQHGKHRQAFERRSTPPGFWRIDMPSTQEQEQDRERALNMEKEKIEERWREAMRGGRWLFRDE